MMIMHLQQETIVEKTDRNGAKSSRSWTSLSGDNLLPSPLTNRTRCQTWAKTICCQLLQYLAAVVKLTQHRLLIRKSANITIILRIRALAQTVIKLAQNIPETTVKDRT